MDADVDEDVELSPSVVVVTMESVRSRVDDEAVVGDCASSASVAGSTGGVVVETERPVSCWLMPFCACET